MGRCTPNSAASTLVARYGVNVVDTGYWRARLNVGTESVAVVGVGGSTHELLRLHHGR